MELENFKVESDFEEYEMPEINKVGIGHVALAKKHTLCSGLNALQQPVVNFNYEINE